MTIKSNHTVFLAFPFDAAILPMYKQTLVSLKKRFGIRFNFIYGNNNVIRPTPRTVTTRLFKAQNDDLLKQFLANIRASDVIVADLTHNNPNVHVELGIAITLNKNILRLSSRNIFEVGSDVKGYDINSYNNQRDLEAKIGNYLEQFLRIKDAPLSKKSGILYARHFWSGETLKHHDQEPLPVRKIGFLRDGVVRLRFKLQSIQNETVWLGIYFRYGLENPWLTPGYLAYIRRNGMFELAELPGVRILKKWKFPKFDLNKEYILEIAFTGNKFVAQVGKSRKFVKTDELSIQSPGWIAIGNVHSTTVVRNVEVVSRDTINSER